MTKELLRLEPSNFKVDRTRMSDICEQFRFVVSDEADLQIRPDRTRRISEAKKGREASKGIAKISMIDISEVALCMNMSIPISLHMPAEVTCRLGPCCSRLSDSGSESKTSVSCMYRLSLTLAPPPLDLNVNPA
jgi:hypothetical protein